MIYRMQIYKQFIFCRFCRVNISKNNKKLYFQNFIFYSRLNPPDLVTLTCFYTYNMMA